jgi:bifunctional DNA-binding transcriptional regulator/antitoxin component of YhaV-PrlF toxin-antitoxin module
MELNNEEMRSWTVPIDEEGVLTFPDELIALTGWKEGDSLEWVDRGDGSFLLVKTDDSGKTDEIASDD